MADALSHHQQIRVISAERRGAAESVVRDVWSSRSILWMLMRRDLRARYAGSMLGIFWNVVHPVVMVLIYILILGTIVSRKFGGEMDRGGYAIYLCAGMIPWLVFQEILNRCSSVLLENAALIKKVAFPEIVLHLVATLNATLVHAVSYAAFLLILAVLGAWPGTQALACFGLLAAVAVFALGIGLVASVLNIYFRDVGQVVSVGLQFLFWFTPIVYPYSILRDADSPLLARIGFLMNFNPLAHFTRTSQWLFGGAGGEAWFSWTSVGVVILGPALALAAGLALFHRFRRDMMDNL